MPDGADFPTAEEAQRPLPPDPGSEEVDGRSRLVKALVKPARTQMVVALILALVGFAGVTQVRANEVDDSFAGVRQQDLIDILNGLAGTSQRAERELARLEQTRDDLQSDSSRRQAALDQAENEAATLSILAGLVPVTGPGIRVTIKEVTGQITISTLLDVVQETRTFGAEAIQFNGEVRVVAQTSFEDVGDAIEVDGVRLTAPYVIDIIGEPAGLEGAINFSQGPRAQVRDDGGELEVQTLTSLDIESIRQPVPPEYAEPQVGQ
ncbi:hypothetical protein GCM10027020_06580 [Nocardioides salsibiostraticola]